MITTIILCIYFNVNAQNQDVDCGVRALNRIFQYYNYFINYNTLKDHCIIDPIGCNFQNLKTTADYFGFKAIGRKVSYEKLINSGIPCIAHINQNHFIAIIGKSGDSVIVSDTGKKHVIYEKNSFLNVWNGEILYIVPDSPLIKFIKFKNSKIYIKQNTINIGKISNKKNLSFYVSVVNIGNADLKLFNVKTSCSCVEVNDKDIPMVIKPLEKKQIKILLKGSKLIGPQNIRIFISSNDPDNPITILKVIGEISSTSSWYPEKIYLGKIHNDSKIEREVVIKKIGNKNFKITDIVDSCSLFEIKFDDINLIKEYCGIKRIRMHLFLKNDAMHGLIDTVIRIYTNDDEFTIIEIPVKGEIISDLRVQPEQLSFGIIRYGSNKEKQLNIYHRKKQKFNVKKIENNIKDLNIRLINIDSSNYKIMANFKNITKKISNEIIHEDIIIYTDNLETPLIKVPILAVNEKS